MKQEQTNNSGDYKHVELVIELTKPIRVQAEIENGIDKIRLLYAIERMSLDDILTEYSTLKLSIEPGAPKNDGKPRLRIDRLGIHGFLRDRNYDIKAIEAKQKDLTVEKVVVGKHAQRIPLVRLDRFLEQYDGTESREGLWEAAFANHQHVDAYLRNFCELFTVIVRHFGGSHHLAMDAIIFQAGDDRLEGARQVAEYCELHERMDKSLRKHGLSSEMITKYPGCGRVLSIAELPNGPVSVLYGFFPNAKGEFRLGYDMGDAPGEDWLIPTIILADQTDELDDAAYQVAEAVDKLNNEGLFLVDSDGSAEWMDEGEMTGDPGYQEGTD